MTYLNAIRDFTRNHPVWATIIGVVAILLAMSVFDPFFRSPK